MSTLGGFAKRRDLLGGDAGRLGAEPCRHVVGHRRHFRIAVGATEGGHDAQALGRAPVGARKHDLGDVAGAGVIDRA